MDPLLEMAQNESNAFMHQLIEQKDLRGRTLFHYTRYTNAKDIIFIFCQLFDKMMYTQRLFRSIAD